MKFELTTHFPNGLMYLVLEDDPEVPDIDGIANLWRTKSMVAQAVLHDAEGEVQFTVSDSSPRKSMTLLFQDVLYSSRLKLEVWNVYIDSLATFQVEAEDFSVRVWGDDPRESSEVYIQFLSGNPSLVV
jgi:hypothetical protein